MLKSNVEHIGESRGEKRPNLPQELPAYIHDNLFHTRPSAYMAPGCLHILTLYFGFSCPAGNEYVITADNTSNKKNRGQQVACRATTAQKKARVRADHGTRRLDSLSPRLGRKRSRERVGQQRPHWRVDAPVERQQQRVVFVLEGQACMQKAVQVPQVERKHSQAVS